MDPITFVTAAKAASAGLGAVSSYAKGVNEEARLKSEARLAETQALQRDTISREELGRTLSGIRAARGANGLSAFSPNALLLMKTAGDNSAQDRQINRSNSAQQAANLRASAKSAKRRGTLGLLTGMAKTAIPIYQERHRLKNG